MFSDDPKLKPYKYALFGAFALYLYKTHKRNQELEDGGGSPTKFAVDTDKLSTLAAHYVPLPQGMEQYRPNVRTVLKSNLDILLEKVKK